VSPKLGGFVRAFTRTPLPKKEGGRLSITQPLFLVSSFGIASKTTKKPKEEAPGFDFKPLRA